MLYHRGIQVALFHLGCLGVKAGRTTVKKQTNILMYLGAGDKSCLALLYKGILFLSIYGYHVCHWILFNMRA